MTKAYSKSKKSVVPPPICHSDTLQVVWGILRFHQPRSRAHGLLNNVVYFIHRQVRFRMEDVKMQDIAIVQTRRPHPTLLQQSSITATGGAHGAFGSNDTAGLNPAIGNTTSTGYTEAKRQYNVEDGKDGKCCQRAPSRVGSM